MGGASDQSEKINEIVLIMQTEHGFRELKLKIENKTTKKHIDRKGNVQNSSDHEF